MSYKHWIIIAISLFGIGIILGLATPTGTPAVPAEDIAELANLAELLATLPKLVVFIVILIKNITAILISFVLSPLLCLVPVIALALNGWIVGLVSAIVLQQEFVGYLLTGLLPHGVFEIPAFIMGEAVALSLGTAVMMALFNKEKRSQLTANFRQNLRYLIIALSLLLPAAIIETFVTPRLLS